MPSCGHEDWPCCNCGDDLERYDDDDLCPGCGEPESYCVCGQDDEPHDDGMDGDHENALASAGWGVDEVYLPGGYED